ncbi:MAG: SDR family oxidoreductase [Candidatus Nitronauta litoralis]|uniref:SDR family oxidoreductase n=1 Tax=Candidatus Nitronauta litoralis TaxID=2705533 RepID=A0A7T0BTD4_9BACT|nr:MAG: SDR family oxidoreductase [Candidatus Nitronauta litoralis]
MDPEKVNYHYTDDLPTKPLPPDTRVLVTGANGYVGRRLVPELLFRGYRVRCMLRTQTVAPILKHPNLEYVYADGRNPEQLDRAMEGMEVAYYLMHSLRLDKREFSGAEKEVARNFVQAANKWELERIVYLGGLGETSKEISPHLSSRIEVGAILSEARCTVVRVRAAIILGTGSASYELIKSLVLHHRWIPFLSEFNSRCQPIAVRDVIKYLVGLMELPDLETGKYPIGGQDVLTYRELVKRFAKIMKRKIGFIDVGWVPVPVFIMIRIFGWWMHLISPVSVNIVTLLLESLRTDVVCPDNYVRELIPFEPLDFNTAVIWALEKEKNRKVFSHWTDVPPENMGDLMPICEYESTDFVIDEHSIDIPEEPQKVFDIVCRIGGKHGWLHGNFLWEIRGWIDRLLGGVGLHRGRRDDQELRLGDSVDFWRVEILEPPRELLLRAELMSPGFSWLQFSLVPLSSGGTRLTLKAHFIPYRFWGQLYWGFMQSFHTYIFKGMLNYFYRQAVNADK